MKSTSKGFILVFFGISDDSAKECKEKMIYTE